MIYVDLHSHNTYILSFFLRFSKSKALFVQSFDENWWLLILQREQGCFLPKHFYKGLPHSEPSIHDKTKQYTHEDSEIWNQRVYLSSNLTPAILLKSCVLTFQMTRERSSNMNPVTNPLILSFVDIQFWVWLIFYFKVQIKIVLNHCNFCQKFLSDKKTEEGSGNSWCEILDHLLKHLSCAR